MSKKYITTGLKILGFNLTSKDLKFTSFPARTLSFQTTSKDNIYINNSRVLSFKIDDYDQTGPYYAIVLEFITGIGGII